MENEQKSFRFLTLMPSKEKHPVCCTVVQTISFGHRPNH